MDAVQRGSGQKKPIIDGLSPLVKNGFNEFQRVMPASAYVNKRSQQKNFCRVKSASCNKATVFASPNTKTFYPEGYFKRVGYSKDNGNAKVRKTDALGQHMKERFNEELEDQRSVYSKASRSAVKPRNLDKLQNVRQQRHGDDNKSKGSYHSSIRESWNSKLLAAQNYKR